MLFRSEYKVCAALINEIGGGPKKVLNTTFDYALTSPWDLKVHSRIGLHLRQSWSAQLNDKRAIMKAVDETGLGFIVLSGIPTYDEDFTIWHKKLRGNAGDTFGRLLKKNFVSERVDFFFIRDQHQLKIALRDDLLADFRQGRQPNGSPRKIKLSLNLDRAFGSDMHIGSHNFI